MGGKLRAAVTARIRAQLPDSQGAIASAIITGERGGIDPEDEAALRDAGLAHVLAIAGLHMALVGAGLFWLVRALLALIPALALAYPIKKWAASSALGWRGLLSRDQRRLVFGDARLCHAGDDAAGDPARPARAFHAQPGAGGDDPSSGAAGSDHRAGISDVLRRGRQPDRGGGMGSRARERVASRVPISIAICAASP